MACIVLVVFLMSSPDVIGICTSPEDHSSKQEQGTRHSTPAAVHPVTGTAGRREPHLLLVFPFGDSNCHLRGSSRLHSHCSARPKTITRAPNSQQVSVTVQSHDKQRLGLRPPHTQPSRLAACRPHWYPLRYTQSPTPPLKHTVLVQVTWPRSASKRKVTRVKDGSIRVPFQVLWHTNTVVLTKQGPSGADECMVAHLYHTNDLVELPDIAAYAYQDVHV